MAHSSSERDTPLCDAFLRGGSIQALGSIGVYVPDGMTAEMVLAGTRALEDEFGVDHYLARSMARKLWGAMSTIANIHANRVAVDG
jgi:hypothetical protein